MRCRSGRVGVRILEREQGSLGITFERRLRRVGAAQNALGEPPRARRRVRYSTGRSADPPENGRYLRISVLPLCDGFALALAVLLAMPRWQGSGYALVVLALLSVNGAHRLRICLRISDEIPRLTAFVAAPLVLLLPWEIPGRHAPGPRCRLSRPAQRDARRPVRGPAHGPPARPADRIRAHRRYRPYRPGGREDTPRSSRIRPAAPGDVGGPPRRAGLPAAGPWRPARHGRRRGPSRRPLGHRVLYRHPGRGRRPGDRAARQP